MYGTTSAFYADHTDGDLYPTFYERPYRFKIDTHEIHVLNDAQPSLALNSDLPYQILTKIWGDCVVTKEVIKIGTKDNLAVLDVMRSMRIDYFTCLRLRANVLLAREYIQHRATHKRQHGHTRRFYQHG